MDRGEAEVRLAEFILAHERPRDAEPAEVRLALLLADYLEEHAINLASGEAAAIAVDHLVDFFQGCLVSEVMLERQEAYVAARRRRGIANGTINRELAVLRASLERARKRGVLRSAPFILSLPSAPPRERWLTPEEAHRLIEACTLAHLRLFVQLAINTAARPSAIFDLTWFQIDLDRRTIDFNAPGRRQTTKRRPAVRMTETLRGALVEARRSAKSEHVVEFHGRPVRTVAHTFRKAARAAGLEGVTPYTLRHTAATWMAQAGVPMWEVAGMMGHTTTRVTERVYAKHSPDAMKRAAAALDSALYEGGLRASRAQPVEKKVSIRVAKPLIELVEPRGIEPLTSTMPL